MAGWLVSVETNGVDGWGYYYLDAAGEPTAGDRNAYVWSTRAAARAQATRWEKARIESSTERNPNENEVAS